MNRRLSGVAAWGTAVVLPILGVAGCSLLPGGPTASGPTDAPISSPAVTSEPSATPVETGGTPSETPTSPASSQTPTPTVTATAKPATAKATMMLYENLVSDKLKGTCSTTTAGPGFKVSDKKNDFFETVDASAVLSGDRKTVTSLTADFGEDSEGVTRKLVYATPAKSGETAVLTVSGKTFKISGKALMFENGARTGSLIPYSLSVTCSADAW